MGRRKSVWTRKKELLEKSFDQVVTDKLVKFQGSNKQELDFGLDVHADEYVFIHSEARRLGMNANFVGKAGKFRTVITKQTVDDLRLTAAQRASIQQFIELHPISESDISRHVHEVHNGQPQGPCIPLTSSSTSSWTSGSSDSESDARPWGRIPPAPVSESEDAKQLPAFRYKNQVIDAIERSTITLVTGGTGCGKTTQVPQFLLERARETNTPLRIMCTQPRRLPAIAVAERVAKERGEPLGTTVGYHIRLEKMTSPETVLTYCTSGVLMRMLSSDNVDNIEYSHIILDEIHERETNTDYLLIALRRALKKRKDLKVILMSATMEGNQELFMDYFKGSDIAHVDINERRFTVDNFMLSEVIALTGYTGPISWKRRNAAANSSSEYQPKGFPATEDPEFEDLKKNVQDALQSCRRFRLRGYGDDAGVTDNMAKMQVSDPGSNGEVQMNGAKSASAKNKMKNEEAGEEEPDTDEQQESKKHDIPGRPAHFHPKVVKIVKNANLDHEAIVEKYHSFVGDAMRAKVDMNLALAIVKYIMGSDVDGAILIFLPGLDEIMTLWSMIEKEPWRMGSPTPTICMLHSQLDPIEQRRVFEPVLIGRRKVILSTNISESSLTFDDVIFIVDCGKMKQNYVTLVPARHGKDGDVAVVSQLKTIPISKCNAEQRSGRAGRVFPGYCFRLFSYEEHEAMAATPVAEMHRSPLHDVCLHAKMFESSMLVKEFLALAPEPPTPDGIDSSLRFLEQLGAVYWEGGRPTVSEQTKASEPQMTELGRVMAQLPMESQLARLLLFGYSLRCLAPIVTLVAILSHRDPFTITMYRRGDDACDDFARRAAHSRLSQSRDQFARGDYSDHVMLMRAFHEWTEVPLGYKRQWCRRNSLAPSGMNMIEGIRNQLLGELVRLGFIPSAATALDDPVLNEHSGNWPMVQAAIVAGSHPHIAYIEKSSNMKTSIGSKVDLHPGAVVKRLAEKTSQHDPQFQFVAFQEHVRLGTGLKVRTATSVPSTTVALFGGPIRLTEERLLKFCIPSMDDTDDDEDVNVDNSIVEMKLENWMPVRGTPEELRFLIQLRFKIMDYFLAVLQTPSLLDHPEAKDLLSLLAEVLEAEHRNKHIKEATAFGTHSVPPSAEDRPQMCYEIGRGGGGGKGMKWRKKRIEREAAAREAAAAQQASGDE